MLIGEVSVDRTIVEGIKVVEEGVAVVVRMIVDGSAGCTSVVVAVTVVGSAEDEEEEEDPSARTNGRADQKRTKKRKLRSNRGRWYIVEEENFLAHFILEKTRFASSIGVRPFVLMVGLIQHHRDQKRKILLMP